MMDFPLDIFPSDDDFIRIFVPMVIENEEEDGFEEDDGSFDDEEEYDDDGDELGDEYGEED